jgi:hypothetical protein
MAGMCPTPKGFTFGAALLSDNTNTLNSKSLGVFSGRKVDGTQKWFVGTATKIYESNSTGSSLTDRSLTAYSASTTQTWSFCQFGDVTLATNLGNVIGQTSGSTFASVSGAPKAQIIINAGPPTSPFILAMNYDDGITPNKAGVYNSAIADYTGWTVGTLQSAQFTIYEPSGPIVAGIAYRDGAIAFKDSSLFELTYSAIQTTPGWGARRIASDVGCCGKNMCVNVNDTIYFADKRGVWMYDGSYPKKLPGYIHDYWASIVKAGNVDDTCQMRWDPAQHNLWLSYKGASDARFWLVWNQLSGLWGKPDVVGSVGASTADSPSVREFISMDGTTLAACHGVTAEYVNGTQFGIFQWGVGTFLTTPSMTLWYIGDQIGRTRLQKVAPVWTSSTQLDATSTATATAYITQGAGSLGTTGAVQAYTDANSGLALFFPLNVTGNWIKVVLNPIAYFEFGSIGLSTMPEGQLGTR